MTREDTVTLHMDREGTCKPLRFPVDKMLLDQRKCRTQALKQLLSKPSDSIETAEPPWKLMEMISNFLS